jgi:hypothetical protein
MNGLSLEHKSCCDRHGLTHGLTTHHDLESLSTVTNFSNRESFEVEEKGISTQQSSSIQNNPQYINSNHPTIISTPSIPTSFQPITTTNNTTTKPTPPKCSSPPSPSSLSQLSLPPQLSGAHPSTSAQPSTLLSAAKSTSTA